MYSGQPIFQEQLWGNGPVPGQFYNFPGSNAASSYSARKEYTTPGYGTQRNATPITTGSSVVGIKFDGGVMIGADNLVSYGSMARYQNVQRVFKVNERTVMGTGGDYADFQSLKRSIDHKVVEDVCYDDGIEMKPKSLYNWLTRVFYNRRSQMNPLWLEMVVGGMEDNVPFLGHIDFRGRAYVDDVIATGFGKHLTLPLVREKLTEGKVLTQAEASELLRKCMEVCYYRDCRAMDAYSVAICTKEGSVVQGPFKVKQNWELAALVKGY